MKSTVILRSASCLAMSSVIVCVLILTACGNRAGDQVKSKDAGAARNDRHAIPANSATPKTPSAPITGKATPGQTQTRNSDNARASNVPTPQVGTGGSDLFLFTQARAALGADNELKSSNIVIDVKAGLLTLSGTVANADQKSKAEQLVRAVDGVKAIKNQLRISIAAAGTKPRVG
jgi:hypothetical protein